MRVAGRAGPSESALTLRFCIGLFRLAAQQGVRGLVQGEGCLAHVATSLFWAVPRHRHRRVGLP